METSSTVDTNSIDLENGDGMSSASTQQNETNVALDGNKKSDSVILNELKENILETLEKEDRKLSDIFFAEVLSTSSNTISDELEGDAVQSPEPCNAETLNVLCTKFKDNPVQSNVNDLSEKETSAITGDIHNSVKNVCMESKADNSASEQANDTTEPLKNGYRCQDTWSEDDESSSTSSDSSSDSDDTFFQVMREGPAPKTVYPIMKTKGELDLDDLPPIEDLVISVEEREVERIGKIYAIVEKLVIVHALKDSKPLDLDSVLFLSHDKPLGRIFDVFGPVVEPFYSVRFNSVDHIYEKDVKVNADVFFAPEKNDITLYVFVDDLQNQKGSDASWRHNNEPPEEFLDYSDDEQEKAAKKKRMVKHRNQSFNSSSDVATKKPSLAGDTPDRPIYIPPRPAQRRNLHGTTSGYYRTNPFSTPRPVFSPAPAPIQRFAMISPAPSPFGIHQPNQIHLPFSIQSPPPPLPYQQPPNMLQRHPQSPLVFPTQQQPVFGQFSIMSPALHTPPPFQPTLISNVPSLIPATHLSPMSPQNYFNQRFPRSHSPALQNGSVSPDPWLPNRAPYQQSNLPFNAPLTVQIPPPNVGSPSLPPHTFEQANRTVQQFANPQNVNFQPQFANQQNMHFPNSNIHPRFY